jgi:hypothetical protein
MKVAALATRQHPFRPNSDFFNGIAPIQTEPYPQPGQY